MPLPNLWNFEESYYLAQNPDVAAAVRAGIFDSALSHWQAYGAAEGRIASQFFDWQVYRDNNPDLVMAGLTSQAALIRHFNAYGINEARVFLNPRLFDAQYYAQHNPDLAAAGIISQAALEQHFKIYGVNEGRIASPNIDGVSYVNQYADLRAYMDAGGSMAGLTNRDAVGIYHYYHYGLHEQRSLGNTRANLTTTDARPSAAASGSILADDHNNDSVFNAGDVIRLSFSEPVKTSVLDGMALHGGTVGGTYRAVDAVNGYATMFEYEVPPGARVLAGHVFSVHKNWVIDQNGNSAASDIYFVIPQLPKTPPVYPAFGLTLDVGGDRYVDASEEASAIGITARVTSSAIRSLVVSGSHSGAPVEETATWNLGTQTYEFDAANFDDGVLTVVATDVYGQTQSFTLIKDTVGPTILAFSVAGPNSLSVTSSESGSAGLYNGGSLIYGTGSPIAAASTPTTLSVSAQSSVITAMMLVFDSAGMGTTSTTAVVLGTSGADMPLAGSVGSDYMFGFGGNDSITGNTSDDVIYGGDGQDTIRGGAGNDSLLGEAGNDRFMYDIGVSLVIQGVQPRFDSVDGGDGTDTIYALAGNGAPTGADLTDDDFAHVSNMEAISLLSLSRSASVVLGANANTAFANGIAVTIDPSTTVNAIVDGAAYAHNMSVTGSAQNDSITGGSGSDSLSGGNGNDIITGGFGNDTMTGGAGVNTFNVDSVTDTITDLKAGDTLNVNWGAYAYVSLLDLTTATVNNNGSIYITGSSSADSITGSSGLDIINGAEGNDTINGGPGSDQLYGDEGNDVFVYTDNFALYADITIVGGDGTDRIQFTTAINTLAGDPLNNNFHADFTRVSSVEQVELFGASSVNLGDVFPNVGVTTIITGNDNTALRYDATVLGSIVVDATAMADNKTLTLFQNNTYAGNNVFAVTNLRGDVDASGLDGNVSVVAASGSGFAVSVLGGFGNDTITGGSGADSMTGGYGDDVFRFISGAELNQDVLVDGEAGTNRIEITAADLTIVDADFTDVANVQTLALTGASGVTLGDKAKLASLVNVITGNDATSVTTAGTSTAVSIDATLLADAKVLTLADTNAGAFTVMGLLGDVDAAGTTASVTVTTGTIADTKNVSVVTGAAATTTTITGDAATADNGAVIVNATAMLDDRLLTIDGDAKFTVTDLLGDVNAALATASVDITTRTIADTKNVSVVTGAAATTITADAATADNGAVIVNATAMLDDTLLTIDGDAKFTVTDLLGNVNAALATASLTVTTGRIADTKNVSVFTGAAATTITGDAATTDNGAVNVVASALADNITLDVNGNAKYSIVDLKGDLDATGSSGSLSLILASAAGINMSLTAGTGNVSVIGGNFANAVTVSGLSTSGQSFTADASMSKFDITGGVNSQIITGSNQDDTITGAAGADKLTGGGGADDFVYTNINQSVAGTLDSVADFSLTDTDKVVFSGVTVASSNQAKVFGLAKEAFANLGAALDQAAKENALDNGVVVFQWDGDTYLYREATGSGTTYTATDLVVELVGTVGTVATTLATDFYA